MPLMKRCHASKPGGVFLRKNTARRTPPGGLSIMALKARKHWPRQHFRNVPKDEASSQTQKSGARVERRESFRSLQYMAITACHISSDTRHLAFRDELCSTSNCACSRTADLEDKRRRTILKQAKSWLYKEHSGVLSNIIFYLLQDGEGLKVSKYRVCRIVLVSWFGSMRCIWVHGPLEFLPFARSRRAHHTA